MANNRLWLVHEPSGESIYLGKRMGYGWYGAPDSLGEQLNQWFDSLQAKGEQDCFRVGLEDPSRAPEGTLEMHPSGEVDDG